MNFIKTEGHPLCVENSSYKAAVISNHKYNEQENIITSTRLFIALPWRTQNISVQNSGWISPRKFPSFRISEVSNVNVSNDSAQCFKMHFRDVFEMDFRHVFLVRFPRCFRGTFSRSFFEMFSRKLFGIRFRDIFGVQV
jgi:hypothetical protein